MTRGITASTVSGTAGTAASLPWAQRSSRSRVPVARTARAKIPRRRKTEKSGEWTQYPAVGEVDSGPNAGPGRHSTSYCCTMSVSQHATVVRCRHHNMPLLYGVGITTCHCCTVSVSQHATVVRCRHYNMPLLCGVGTTTCHCCAVSASQHATVVQCQDHMPLLYSVGITTCTVIQCQHHNMLLFYSVSITTYTVLRCQHHSMYCSTMLASQHVLFYNVSITTCVLLLFGAALGELWTVWEQHVASCGPFGNRTWLVVDRLGAAHVELWTV